MNIFRVANALLVTALVGFLTAGCRKAANTDHSADSTRHLSVGEAVTKSLANAHFATGTGDVGEFLLQQVLACGGTPVMTNKLPAISGSWHYTEERDGVILPKDTDGVIIQMGREQYPAVEAFFQQAFGEPHSRTQGDPNQRGGALDVMNVYRFLDGKGGISFGYNSECTLVVMVRPIGTRRPTTPKTQ